jgi:LysR family transcriptional activator of glutamate synthase operon
MDWHQLKYFQTLASEENITKAADKLNLSQPALSRSISRLEEEIGVPLFERMNRGVILNQYGKIFLQHANQALSEIDEAIQKINDMVNPLHGTISLAFIQTLGSSYVPDLISEFQKKFPNITFQLYQDTTTKILKQVDAAEINIGFCSPQEPIEHLGYSLIVKEELYLIVPASHRLAGVQEVDLIEVSEEPFILFKQDTALREVIDKLCVEAGFHPKIAFEGLEERTVANLVGANFGVAIIPFFPDLHESKVSLIRVRKPQCFRNIYMVWKAQGYMSPAVTTFKKFAIENPN